MDIKTDFDFELWTASIWIERDYFHASGGTEEIAKKALLDHLEGIMPIYENRIVRSQNILNKIKELLCL
jgi:hypothetical protein